MARLTAALETCLSPEALLFDLDGVLADVGGSYRQCVIRTARSFGCHITREDLQQAKLAGDANNDWVLTQRLLEQRGISASLDEVTERYQACYFGSDGQVGLRESERPLLAPEKLAEWSRRFRIGVVTGRPRAEAEWFLAREGYADSAHALVCMEDAKVKPDPAPVRLALERLGVTRAWMVGDTPDDVRAASEAGVLPLGIVAPEDDEGPVRQRLLETGATSVLTNLEQLEILLP